jgi:3-phenylpropionate/trans-cinnamate dioxygenase ferredoxin reductase subunit
LRRIVVVGGGLAGYRAARALRRAGFDGDLYVVGNEVHRPYDRPPLSKELLGGNKPPSDCFYDSDGLEAHWLLGRPATGLDPTRRVVRLGAGDELPYDGVVIATGRRARAWPDLPDLEGFHLLRGLEDAKALQRAISAGGRTVIVGAGFIGCEVAATLRGMGVENVTLLDVAALPMPALGPEIGVRAARLHRSHGVRLRMETSVGAFEGRDRVEAVRLRDGELIEADIVLFALGSVPNSDWLAGSGLELMNGCVACDETCMAVGVANVAVAGDIAAYPHPWAQGRISIEHWANARDMGTLAGANLLREPHEREPFVMVPTFWSDQYDVKIKSAGLIGIADAFTVVFEDPARGALVVEARRGNSLVGAVVFNRNRTIIDYQRTLEESLARVPLTPASQRDVQPPSPAQAGAPVTGSPVLAAATDGVDGERQRALGAPCL